MSRFIHNGSDPASRHGCRIDLTAQHLSVRLRIRSRGPLSLNCLCLQLPWGRCRSPSSPLLWKALGGFSCTPSKKRESEVEVGHGGVWVKTKDGEGDVGSPQTGDRGSAGKVLVGEAFCQTLFPLDPPPGTGCSAHSGFGGGAETRVPRGVGRGKGDRTVPPGDAALLIPGN